ncbi:MAG: prolyl aminopeptidase, partial [Gammaproteobacteria bacterium]
VADIERLREEIVGVPRWQVFGGSWGSTLALAYAETHPQRVSALVLRGVYTVTKAELQWYYQFGVSEMFPDKWEGFQAPIPVEERHDMIAAYRRRLVGDDEAARLACAQAWTIWEGETITLLPDAAFSEPFRDPHFALAFARIENHYFVHGAWLEEGQLLRDAHRLKGIPGAIVHGRYDMPCPMRYAWSLHQAWPDANFHRIEGAGHAYSEPGILDALIRETDRLADRRCWRAETSHVGRTWRNPRPRRTPRRVRPSRSCWPTSRPPARGWRSGRRCRSAWACSTRATWRHCTRPTTR